MRGQRLRTHSLFDRPTPYASTIDTQFTPYTPHPPSSVAAEIVLEGGTIEQLAVISTAEAVGLAASIGGLVSIASKVSKSCREYFSDARNAQKDIQQLLSEISSLDKILEPLSTPAQAGDISQASRSDSMSQLVHQCTEMLEKLQDEIQDQLNKQSGSKTRNIIGSLKTSLKWPLKKEDTQEVIQRIERLKSAIALKMQM